MYRLIHFVITINLEFIAFCWFFSTIFFKYILRIKRLKSVFGYRKEKKNKMILKI